MHPSTHPCLAASLIALLAALSACGGGGGDTESGGTSATDDLTSATSSPTNSPTSSPTNSPTNSPTSSPTTNATSSAETGDASTGDVTSTSDDACSAQLLDCSDTCVNPDDDPAHCGECDNACAPGIPCFEGQCGCDEDRTLCADICAVLANDEAHCGACGNACPGEQLCVYSRCVDSTINYVLIGGQSLSIGYNAQALSTEEPYDNLMLNTGVRAGATGLTHFVPLVELQQDDLGETIASGLTNLIAELELAQGRAHVLAASAHGAGGAAYELLKKGTASFTTGMTQVAAATQIATAQGDTLAVRAVAMVHGESDHVNGNLAYADNLLTWQSDYEADIKAITGQAHPVPMFLCQMSSWTAGNVSTSPIPLAQLEAADARPDRIFIVGPKYFLPYSDVVHLTGDGERWLGEHYAKVYRKVLIDGERWTPLRPRSLTREGPVITVDFHVPSPPLAFDTDLVLNPGNYGFEFSDTSGAPPAIVSVELTGETQVQITLADTPVGDEKRLAYAFYGVPGQVAGPTTGARGNLRDSDPTPSRHGYPLYNWGVHFNEPVD